MGDVAAWLIFAIVVASFKGDASIAVIAFVGAVAYAAVVYGPLRPWLRRLARQADESGEVSQATFGTILMLLMIGAWFTDRIGVHSVFGAFILGTAVPARPAARRSCSDRSARSRWACSCHSISCTRACTPRSGWSTRRRCGWSRSAIFAVACLGKGVACWLAARLNGATQPEALGIGTLMNARGMMELILLNIGRERGLITPTLFTILVLMTLATTLMATPLFGLLYRPAAAPAIDDDAAAVRGA